MVLPLTLSSQRRLEVLAARRDALVEQSLSPNTQRAYAQCWRQYTRFCTAHGLVPEAPDAGQAALFLCSLDRPSASRVQQLAAAIRWQLDRLGRPLERLHDGDLRRVVRALVRQDAGRRRRRVRPIGRSELAAILATLGGSPIDLRDRALIMLGYAAALRRAELAALDLGDIALGAEASSVLLTIRTSKTDQEGRGHRMLLEGDQSAGHGLRQALLEWLAIRGLSAGPLYVQIRRGGRLTAKRLSGHAIARLLKTRAAAVGLPAAAISGHALRAGWVTDADAGGMSIGRIAQHSRHRDPGSVMPYIRPPGSFTPDNWHRLP